MTVDPVVEAAREAGCLMPEHAYEAAKLTGVPMWVICTLLEMETGGGRNIFGHDPTIFVGAGKVTRRKYRKYKRERERTGLCQGVGPMQLTWRGFQDRADELGGCWKPAINIRVGAEVIGDLRESSRSWREAARRYNGSGPAAQAYARDFAERAKRWRRVLSSAAAPAAAPEPTQETTQEATPVRKIPKNPYARTTYGGKTVNWRTRAMLEVVAERLYGDPEVLTVHQGSYNAGGVAASAGTHDGGGAVDLSAYDWKRKVTELRRVGFAAWYRPTIPGLWNEHIHAIAIGDKEMSAGARAQVQQYFAHTDGLAGHGYDSFPYHPTNKRFNYKAWRKKQLQKEDWLAMASKQEVEALMRKVVREELAAFRKTIDEHVSGQVLWRADVYPKNGNKKQNVVGLLKEILANTKQPKHKA